MLQQEWQKQRGVEAWWPRQGEGGLWGKAHGATITGGHPARILSLHTKSAHVYVVFWQYIPRSKQYSEALFQMININMK
jgi:hypothetical protein